MNKARSLIEKRIEDIFGDEPFDPADEELFKWFLYVSFDKGSGIKNLDSLNFKQFKDKLNLLVDAVYDWYHVK